MSETTVLKANIRQQGGSNKTAGLRKQGLLPAVVYGHKKEPVSISLDAHAFLESLHEGHRILDVDIDGQKDTLMVKELQYDHLGKGILHVDLMRVNLSERVKVDVAVDLRGTAEGTHAGGIVELLLGTLEIECTVADMPESIPVNIKGLQLNQSIHAGEIELPAGFKMITEASAPVVTCKEPAVIAEPVAAAEGAEAAASAEPEVITERKKEETAE
jgi:large subunit ribosomal protein L25